MWFIRVLIPLYALFFLTTLFIKSGRGKTGVWLLFAVLTAYSCCDLTFDSIQKHSVPLFALGVLASYYKKLPQFVVLTLVTGLLVSIGTYICTSHPITGFIHVFFDYIAIIALVAFISVRKVEWKLPGILTAITFELYLIHFKVFELVSLFTPLTLFFVVSAVLTFALSYLFNRLRQPIENKLVLRV